jgi:hypothetical protein
MYIGTTVMPYSSTIAFGRSQLLSVTILIDINPSLADNQTTAFDLKVL